MEEVYQLYAKKVYAYLLKQCANKDLAEELTQETFYQAMKSLNSFKEASKVDTWLIGISKNVWFNYLKKKQNYVNIEEIQVESNEDIERRIIEIYQKEALTRSIHTLNEPYKEIIYLRVYVGLSFKEIGRIFEKGENWARVNYYRAKQMLMEDIKDE